MLTKINLVLIINQTDKDHGLNLNTGTQPKTANVTFLNGPRKRTAFLFG